MASSNSGGYEHEFLEPSAKLKKYECPLCLLVTREPHLTGCCGQHFCQACINRIITDRKPCPFCKASSFGVFFDKKQKRKVLELKLKCTMKERGCDWSGELGELDTHVDTRNGSCQFVDVNCPNNCGESHQRCHLANHLSDLCPKRPFTCKYCQFKAAYEQVCNDHYPKCIKYPVPCPNKCEIGTVERGNLEQHVSECPLQVVECHLGCSERMKREGLPKHVRVCPKRPFTCKYCEFKATYEQVCNDHYPKCIKYPVPCPNECEIGTVERGNLEQHVSECPLQVVECEFAHAGCSEKITRKDLPKHMELSVQKHLVLLSSFCVKEMTSVREMLDQKDKLLTELQRELAETKKDTATKLDQKDKQLTELQGKVAETHMKLAEKDKQIEVLQTKVHTLEMVTAGLLPIEFTLANYSQYEGNKRVAGPVLCTAPKIQIKFYFTPLFGHYVCVELHQLGGESDDKLNWPVKCAVTATLLNQSSDQHHISGSQDYELSRPTGERHIAPNVLRVFYSTISNRSKQDRTYLKDDNLKFRFLVQFK